VQCFQANIVCVIGIHRQRKTPAFDRGRVGPWEGVSFAWLMAFMVLGLYRWVQRGADAGSARRLPGLAVRQEPFITEPPKR
jgi:hypothetical protein